MCEYVTYFRLLLKRLQSYTNFAIYRDLQVNSSNLFAHLQGIGRLRCYREKHRHLMKLLDECRTPRRASIDRKQRHLPDGWPSVSFGEADPLEVAHSPLSIAQGGHEFNPKTMSTTFYPLAMLFPWCMQG